jgi:DNA-binding response OmpR family regulator
MKERDAGEHQREQDELDRHFGRLVSPQGAATGILAAGAPASLGVRPDDGPPDVGAVLPGLPQSRSCRWQPACLPSAKHRKRCRHEEFQGTHDVPHALLVDDDADAAETMAMLIASEGFTVATAGTLRDARRQLALQEPDIILLDLMLPDGSGMELFTDAKALPNTELVLITGHASLDTSIQAFRLGAADYLVKPMSLKQLQGVLSRVTRPSALKAAPATWRRSSRRKGISAPSGAVAADAQGLRADRPRRRHRGLGLHHRRERQRQGDRRPHRARPQPAPQPGRSSRSTAARSRRT